MGLKQFLWKIAFKKGVVAIVKGVLAFLAAPMVQKTLEEIGVSIDINVFREALTVAIYGGLEFAQNTLKHRFGVKLP